MKVNFSKVKLTDIDGKVLPGSGVHKTLADVLYKFASSVDFVDLAIAINRGQEVALEKVEVVEIRRLINDPKCGFFTYAKKALFDFLNEAQRKEDQKNRKKNRKRR